MFLEGNLRGAQHLGIPVVDLAAAKRWYREVLSCELLFETTFGEPGGEIAVAFLERAGVVFELYQLPGAALADIAARSDGHIDHIAFDVIDIDQAFADVQAAGLAPIEPAPVWLPFFAWGVRYFAIRGPSGEKIEFNQRLREPQSAR